MYNFKVKIDSSVHDKFVKESSLCNLLQSSSWAKVKENWNHEIVGVYDDEQLIASALVLIKSLPLGFTMMYIPRGPIMDYKNERLVTYFFEQLKRWAKKKHCLYIKMDPAILYRHYHIQEEVVENNELDIIMDHLHKVGVKHLGYSMDMSATIQPRFHAMVYKEDFDETLFPKSCKKMLKIAEKKKVNVAMYGKERIDDFAKIMEATTERKQIALRNKEYFELLMDTYKEDAFLMLATLNLKEIYEETLSRYKQNEIDLANCKENQAKKRFTLQELHDSLTREINELKEFMNSDGEEVVIAGTLSVVFGETSEILYAGMDSRYKRYMAPYITWKKTMEKCFEKGCKSSNMGGIENTLDGGLTKFKRNYYPTIIEYVGEFDFGVNTLLYKSATMMFALRKKRNNRK